MAAGRRVLVTGGAGFIGSHVCEAYLAAGWRVTALDDLSTGRPENVPAGAELVRLDIRSPDVAAVFDRGRFDLVNHHAAQIDVRVSVQDPRRDASINLDGLLNLLENARRAAVARFVLISSGGVVYGEPESVPTPETAPKRPLSPYGVSKLAGEHYLFFYRRVHGLRGVALRYSNVYGPRQDPHGEAGVVAIFSSLLREGRALTLYGDGEQTRDYVYVEDVARANLLVSTIDLPDPRGIDDMAYNVGTGSETSVNRMAECLMRASGTKAEVGRAPARSGELLRSALDASRLRAAGWEPRVTLEDGLARTYAHIAGCAR